MYSKTDPWSDRSSPVFPEKPNEFDSRSGNGSAVALLLFSSLAFILAFLGLLLTGSSFFRALGLSLSFQMLFVTSLLIIAFRRFVINEVAVELDRSPDPSSVPPLEASVWKSFLGQDKSPKSGRVGFAAQVNDESYRIAEDLADEGYEVHLSSDTDAVLNSIEDNPNEWDILILDLDQYSDHGSAVDDLLVFRSVCEETIVVLLSSDVSRDDLSLERMVVTDVTLRKPLSKRRFMSGLVSAHENAAVRRGEILSSLIK
jgi:CheY-like chemotaxis protein